MKQLFVSIISVVQKMPRNLRVHNGKEFGQQFNIPMFADKIDQISSVEMQRIAEQIVLEVETDTVLPLTDSINHLLYLCSQEPDIPQDRELRERRTYDNTGAAKRGATLTVGTRIGTALRGAKMSLPEKATENKQRETQSHCSPVPHVRRAHWHSFWTGKKTEVRELAVKWLPPIPVRVDAYELPSVMRSVQN